MLRRNAGDSVTLLSQLSKRENPGKQLKNIARDLLVYLHSRLVIFERLIREDEESATRLQAGYHRVFSKLLLSSRNWDKKRFSIQHEMRNSGGEVIKKAVRLMLATL